MAGITWTDIELEIVKEKYNIISNDVIGLLLPNRTIKAIKHKAAEFNLCHKLRRYFQDDHYFSKYTMENCYWAGFIAADGNINQDKNKVIIQLSTMDLSLLDKFKKAVGYTGPIRNYKNDFSGMSVLQISSTQMVKDLYSLFNITPKKSKTLIPPPLNSEEYIRSFIRGYFDGDGCLSSQWSVVGTKEMIGWIRENLHKYVGTFINQSIRYRDGINIVEYGGRIQMKLICHWLYKNANQDIFLNRKYQKAERL